MHRIWFSRSIYVYEGNVHLHTYIKKKYHWFLLIHICYWIKIHQICFDMFCLWITNSTCLRKFQFKLHICMHSHSCQYTWLYSTHILNLGSDSCPKVLKSIWSWISSVWICCKLNKEERPYVVVKFELHQFLKIQKRHVHDNQCAGKMKDAHRINLRLSS